MGKFARYSRTVASPLTPPAAIRLGTKKKHSPAAVMSTPPLIPK